MNLTEFLLARIEEDEAVARYEAGDLADQPDAYGSLSGANPRRVLAECEAKRRIVEMAAYADRFPVGPTNETDTGARAMLETVVCNLAAPYADDPDYRQEWKP